jgi:hypothetical protein
MVVYAVAEWRWRRLIRAGMIAVRRFWVGDVSDVPDVVFATTQ